MKWNRTSRQYYNEKYKKTQAVQTIGRDALKTDVNIKAQQEQGPRVNCKDSCSHGLSSMDVCSY